LAVYVILAGSDQGFAVLAQKAYRLY